MAAPKGNKFAVGNRGGSGHPSQYKPAYADQAKKACEAGFTDSELSQLFGVSEMTINNWKLAHKDFALALNAGKGVADSRVERKLYERACGFWVKTERLFVLKEDTLDKRGKVVGSKQYVHHEPTKDYYPPEVSAMIWWQKNRQPDKWRDKHEIDGTIRNEHVFTFNIFENDLSAGMKTIEGKKSERRP